MSKISPLHHKKTDNTKWLLVGDIVGWFGAISLLSGYLLASVGVIEGQSMIYQLLNTAGAAGMLILATVRKAIPSAVANFIWLLIGVITIVNLLI